MASPQRRGLNPAIKIPASLRRRWSPVMTELRELGFSGSARRDFQAWMIHHDQLRCGRAVVGFLGRCA